MWMTHGNAYSGKMECEHAEKWQEKMADEYSCVLLRKQTLQPAMLLVYNAVRTIEAS